MWIFTSFGFFSIVADRNDPRYLIVRARARADLEAFGGRLGIRPNALAIRTTPEADYPFRLRAWRRTVGTVLESIALDVDYPNFKAEVARAQGDDRAHMYHEVWSVLEHRFRPERPAKAPHGPDGGKGRPTPKPAS